MLHLFNGVGHSSNIVKELLSILVEEVFSDSTNKTTFLSSMIAFIEVLQVSVDIHALVHIQEETKKLILVQFLEVNFLQFTHILNILLILWTLDGFVSINFSAFFSFFNSFRVN